MCGPWGRVSNVNYYHYQNRNAYQRKVIPGAVVMLLPSIYPAAPETMQPIASPTMILIFFKNGDPNNSVRTIEMNDKKPRPMNSGEPHGKGRGADILGQSSKNPLLGREAQSLEPPPQFGIPESPMREAPMRRTTVPVTMGGKIRRSMRTGTKARNISRNEHIKDVPAPPVQQ